MPVAVHDHISILLKKLAEKAVPGQSVQSLLDFAEDYIAKNNLLSINKGYNDGRNIPFPYVMCVNINNCIAHGAPSPKYNLLENDIVGFDIGIQDKETKDCGDASLTVGVGTVAKYNTKLLRVAKEALYRGIDVVKPGLSVFEIGDAIEHYALTRGYAVSTLFLGHTIGKQMHEKPHIPMVSVKLEDPTAEIPKEYRLQVGQKICLEPCISQYDKRGMGGNDGWSTFTTDGRNSAMFEHMIEVTEDGYKILTTHIERE